MAFTCAETAAIVDRAEARWAETAPTRTKSPNLVAAQAILTEQTAKLDELKSPSNDNKIKVIWTSNCAAVAQDCTDDCDFSGVEPTGDCKEYELDGCKETNGLSLSHERYRTSDFDRETDRANGIIDHLQILDEYIASTIVGSLDTFAGVNQHDRPGSHDVQAGGETEVKAPYWAPEMFAYFNVVATFNDFRNPYLFGGLNLYEQALLAGWKVSDPTGQSANILFGTMRQYYDLFNVDSNLATKSTFMIDKGAVATVSKSRYSTRPENWVHGANQARFGMASNNLPGIVYDVIKAETCSNGGDITENYKFKARHVNLLNPENSCDTPGEKTGVLRFDCVV